MTKKIPTEQVAILIHALTVLEKSVSITEDTFLQQYKKCGIWGFD